MYMATEWPARFRPPPTARQIPDGRQDRPSRYVLGLALLPRGSAVIGTAWPIRPFDTVTVIARLWVAETAYWPTARHRPADRHEPELIAVNVLAMAPGGAVISAARYQAPRDSTAPIAWNWLGDTL